MQRLEVSIWVVRRQTVKFGVGRQFSRLQAAEVCGSAVVMLHTPCSEVVWRVLATHTIRQFPLHFPSRASPCDIIFQLDSTVGRCATENKIFEIWKWGKHSNITLKIDPTELHFGDCFYLRVESKPSLWRGDRESGFSAVNRKSHTTRTQIFSMPTKNSFIYNFCRTCSVKQCNY